MWELLYFDLAGLRELSYFGVSGLIWEPRSFSLAALNVSDVLVQFSWF